MILPSDLRNNNTLLHNVWIHWIMSETLGSRSHLILFFLFIQENNRNPKISRLRSFLISTFIKLKWSNRASPPVSWVLFLVNIAIPCVIFFILIQHTSYQSLYVDIIFISFSNLSPNINRENIRKCSAAPKTSLIQQILLLKETRISHPKICLFDIKIILSWRYLRNCRCKKGALIFLLFPRSRR